jgi:hypothetical protein
MLLTPKALINSPMTANSRELTFSQCLVQPEVQRFIRLNVSLVADEDFGHDIKLLHLPLSATHIPSSQRDEAGVDFSTTSSKTSSGKAGETATKKA